MFLFIWSFPRDRVCKHNFCSEIALNWVNAEFEGNSINPFSFDTSEGVQNIPEEQVL